MRNQENLKAITRHLVSRVGGAKAAAKICGVSEVEVSYWQNDHHDRFIPIDHLVLLDKAAGDLYLKEWARERGFELVAIETPRGTGLSIFKVIGEFSRHTGELDYVALEALAEGALTPAGKRRIRDHIAPVKDSIADFEIAIS